MPEPLGHATGESGSDQTGCAATLARLLTPELRTPLNAILGYAELLLAGASGPICGEARSAVREIVHAARDLETAMLGAGFVRELDVVFPGAAESSVSLAPLLREAGFQLAAAEPCALPLVIRGSEERWAAILRCVRSYLGRSSRRAGACFAEPLSGPGCAGLRLWSEPGGCGPVDAGLVELYLAAGLACAEGASLSPGTSGDVTLSWSEPGGIPGTSWRWPEKRAA